MIIHKLYAFEKHDLYDKILPNIYFLAMEFKEFAIKYHATTIRLSLLAIASTALIGCSSSNVETNLVYMPTTSPSAAAPATPAPTETPKLRTDEVEAMLEFKKIIKDYSLGVYALTVNEQDMYMKRFAFEMFRIVAENRMIDYLIIDFGEDDPRYAQYEEIAKKNFIVIIKPDFSIKDELTRNQKFSDSVYNYVLAKQYISVFKKAFMVSSTESLFSLHGLILQKTVKVSMIANPQIKSVEFIKDIKETPYSEVAIKELSFYKMAVYDMAFLYPID